MLQNAGMNTGTKAASFVLFGNEIVSIVYDARWFLLAILLSVFADFWLGRGESKKRYLKAKEHNDKYIMSQYRWRTSRAWRRSLNKLSDYLMWVLWGSVIGYAILTHLGIDYIWGGFIATITAILCEASSLFSHFLYLHGVKIEKKTAKGFIKAFVIALAKRKNKDIGEALEAGFYETDKK